MIIINTDGSKYVCALLLFMIVPVLVTRDLRELLLRTTQVEGLATADGTGLQVFESNVYGVNYLLPSIT